MDSQDLSQFIIKSSPQNPIEKKNIDHMEECLKFLNENDEKITSILNRINQIIKKAVNIFPDSFNRYVYTNEVCYASNKFFNLFLKYQALRHKNYSRAKQAIDDLKKLITENLKQNIPIQVKYSEFIKCISKNKDEIILKIQFKLCSLFNYVKNLRNIERNRKITENDLLYVIRKISSKVDVQNDYIRQNMFDLMVESYIESNKNIFTAFLKVINTNDYIFTNTNFESNELKLNKKYDYSQINKSLIFNDFEYYMGMLKIKTRQNISNKAAKDPTKLNFDDLSSNNPSKQKKKEFDFQLFNNLIQKVYFHITSTTKIDRNLFTIFRCACLRFICNKYYISHENEWFEKISDGYVQKCIQIIGQTPREVNISKDLIPEDLYDTSFRTLLLNEDYKKAVKRMFSIQFLLCPIDIWIQMKLSIDLSLKCINSLSKTEESRSNISFDDFFSIVLPVFAEAQIMCPIAINSILVNFRTLPKSSSLDSTAVLAVALTGYMTE